MASEAPYDHWLEARRVCVIGAGTMGSGIAAHLANLGFDVSLLDLTSQSVQEAFDRARQARPPHFTTNERATSVRLGTIADQLSLAADADWVCEAIVENLDAKRSLYAALDGVLTPGAMISTNTSSLPITALAEGRSEGFRSRFLGTHFFNPPRYLKLLELIPTEDTDPGAVRAMTRFLEERVARRVVLAKDTPGFITNRFGMWSMFHAIHTAERLHLSIEEVDAITGPFLGRPRSASFRLNDLVGLDVMRDIAQAISARTPAGPDKAVFEIPASMLSLLARGWIGEKVGQGYYRKEGKELLVLDLQTYAYRQRRDREIATIDELGRLPLGERIGLALARRDEVGEYLREHLLPVLRYAEALKAEVSHSVRDFDRVMRWGFGWQLGPFELMDAIGHERLGMPTPAYYEAGTYLGFDGVYTKPEAEPEYTTLEDFDVIERGDSYNLRALGDGVTALCLTAKMGVFSPAVVDELTALLSSRSLDRIVLASEAKAFSAGFDLNFFLAAILENRLTDIDQALQKFQRLGELLGERTSVAAVFGHCLGGGLEMALSCTRIVASLEAKIGLPESRVGVIPAGRGTTLMRLYNAHGAKRLSEAALTLIEGVTADNADHARALGYLRPTDITSYHPDRLLADARRAALENIPVPRPEWTSTEGPVGGMIDRLIAEGRGRVTLTEHDVTIGHKIRNIFAKSTGYDDALARERSEFLELCSRAHTVARIRHMLETGKPLRN